MKNTLDKAQELFRSFYTDATRQLEKGNKAAGVRARKATLELTKILKEFRKVSVEADKK